MDQATARAIIAERIREEFGKLVELRGLRVSHQPAGRLWVGELVRVSRYGEVRLGEVGITEGGDLTGFEADQLMELMLQIEPLQSWNDLERDRPHRPGSWGGEEGALGPENLACQDNDLDPGELPHEDPVELAGGRTDDGGDAAGGDDAGDLDDAGEGPGADGAGDSLAEEPGELDEVEELDEADAILDGFDDGDWSEARGRLVAKMQNAPDDLAGSTGPNAGADAGASNEINQADEINEVEAFFEGLDTRRLRERISMHLFSNSRRDLLAARELLPLLLPEPEGRAEVLCRMAELELWLGDVDVALGHFEAAARELADRADLAGLEQVALRVAKVLGEQRARRHVICQLLEQTRTRLEPIAWLDQVPVFRGLRGDAAARIAALAREETVSSGTLLIREDDPPVHAFAVKEGRLSVWVEGPSGTPRFIRCCFPGEFVGESTVLGGEGATCTATVRAEGPAVVWRLNGAALRVLAAELPELRRKIDSTGIRHRLDSFFSLSSAPGAVGLDARLRDRLLSCFAGIREVTPGQIVLAGRLVPEIVVLIADGLVEVRGTSSRAVGAGRFVGLRDALHELRSDADCVALEPSRLVCFDSERLRSLAAEAPAEVLAALDALE